MKLNRSSRAAGIAVTAILAASTISAQTFQSGIRGLLEDPGEAVIGNVKVTPVNQNTGVSRTGLSNAEGEYAFAALDPAAYTVRVESPVRTCCTGTWIKPR